LVLVLQGEVSQFKRKEGRIIFFRRELDYL